jgi:hypothetical protein
LTLSLAPIRTLALAAFAAAAAAGSAHAADDKAYNLATRLGAVIERCWIASGDAAFAGYIISPEPNATNGPRILIVPRKTPTAVPVLVIEVIKAGNHVSVYGPLATSSNASRIGADLRRWIAGGDSCT